MDPRKNPFTPGAGYQPPELAGRDSAIQAAQVAAAQINAGRPTQGIVVYGLRGVGKTVLLNVIEQQVRETGFHTISFEATDKVGLGEALIPELRRVLSDLSTIEKAKQLSIAALNKLRELAATLELSSHGVKVAVKKRSENADSLAGSIEVNLRSVLEDVGEAARLADKPLAIFIDEIQYLQLRDEGRELGALIAALHRTGQRNLPIIMFGAALPQIMGIAAKQRSYAERIFRFTKVGPLPPPDAERAIRGPIEDQGAKITDTALAEIVRTTEGYPYFLQEYGRQAWLAAAHSPITEADVARASEEATRALDESFFEARMQRVTERERDYLLAIASLGIGPYHTKDVAEAFGATVTQVAPYRDALIKKGMIWAPARGEIAFTVPMFDTFLRRQ